jgi:hypothetical protein
VATIAATVTALRRILDDAPLKIHLNGAIANATEETVVVDAMDIDHVHMGQVWEHDDGDATSAEQRLVMSVDSDASSFEAYRGHNGSTAPSTHADNSFMLLEPRFAYDRLVQAINTCLDYDLFPQVYEIVEHQVTSSSTSHAYNAPATACERWLDVYQRTVSTAAPERQGITYTVYPQNADTGLWANGKVFEIYGGKADGTEKFYVNCAHRLAIGTLLARQERLVQYCAAKYALEWGLPRRLAGPTNQGDRSVRPADPLVTARYFGDEFERMRRKEADTLKKQVPRRKVFVRGTVTYAHTD